MTHPLLHEDDAPEVVDTVRAIVAMGGDPSPEVIDRMRRMVAELNERTAGR